MIKPLFILILLFIISVFKSGIRPAIQNFNVMTGTDGKSLQLSWKYTEKGDYWCAIYRSGDGKDLMTYKNLTLDQHLIYINMN